MICSVQEILFKKLQDIDEKLEKANLKYSFLEEKMNCVMTKFENLTDDTSSDGMCNYNIFFSLGNSMLKIMTVNT